jgi:hypothetical protein
VVGGFVDGDEEVSRILPLFARLGLRLLLPRGALLRASLLAEALDGGEDGARASLGASRASDGEPRVSGADEMPLAVCADASRAGPAPGDGGERLGVDEVDERADGGAVVELEFVLEGAVAHLDGNVDGEGTLGGLVDVERGVVEGRLVVVDALAGRGAVERQLHLVVRALLLAELVGAAGGGDGRVRGHGGDEWMWVSGGDARGRVGRARGDAGRARGGRDGRSRPPTGVGPLRGWESGAHRTSWVSRSGSVRSTNPLGCAVSTGQGISVVTSSTSAAGAAGTRAEALGGISLRSAQGSFFSEGTMRART